MIGIVLALLAAVAASSSVILVKKWLDESRVLNVTFVITSIGCVISWPLALSFVNLSVVNFGGVLLFAIAGILTPGIGRLLYYKGMETLGASVNASIYATYPLYSSLFAVLLLDEALSQTNWAGILCVVSGVVLLQGISSKAVHENRGFLKKGLVFSVIGALTVGMSHAVRKQGLNIYSEPLLGLAIGQSLSLLLYALLWFRRNAAKNSPSLRKDFRLFWKPGVGMSLSWIFLFYALSLERVSIVTPITQTEPLFIILFSYIFLKGLESAKSRLIICSILIFFGIMLLSLH